MKILIGLIAVLCIILPIYLTSKALVDSPIGYFSWSTQECVKVEDPKNIYSCNNLPKKYTHYWVK